MSTEKTFSMDEISAFTARWGSDLLKFASGECCGIGTTSHAENPGFAVGLTFQSDEAVNRFNQAMAALPDIDPLKAALAKMPVRKRNVRTSSWAPD